MMKMEVAMGMVLRHSCDVIPNKAHAAPASKE
jgi:hypothetical protein